MPQQNQINLNIPETDMADIRASVDTLVARLLPHLHILTASDRLELPKMGDKTVSFVQKSLEYGQKNPELVPAYLSLELMDADLRAVQVLREILQHLSPLVSALEDSMTLAGSEAYQAALMFYRNLKMAQQARIPNAEAIYSDLAARFPGGARAKVAKPV